MPASYGGRPGDTPSASIPNLDSAKFLSLTEAVSRRSEALVRPPDSGGAAAAAQSSVAAQASEFGISTVELSKLLQGDGSNAGIGVIGRDILDSSGQGSLSVPALHTPEESAAGRRSLDLSQQRMPDPVSAVRLATLPESDRGSGRTSSTTRSSQLVRYIAISRVRAWHECPMIF